MQYPFALDRSAIRRYDVDLFIYALCLQVNKFLVHAIHSNILDFGRCWDRKRRKYK